MSAKATQPALLLAAHGERGISAGNEGVAQLAACLAARHVAAEIGFGFLKGNPSIAEAIGVFLARKIAVYPLFLSDGYFYRVRLSHSLDAAKGSRAIRILPPLGLDPALAKLVTAKGVAAATAHGLVPEDTVIVLFAHGSTNDAVSRLAAERLAQQISKTRHFASVNVALLEEFPSLGDALSEVTRPAVVIGLFAGEGLHGGSDVPCLISAFGRTNIVFAGNVGSFAEIADVVAAAVRSNTSI